MVLKKKEGTPKGRRSDSFVEAFAKGLTIIKAFPTGKESVSTSELAAATSMSRATVRRLALTLVELGYAIQKEDAYSLTPKILELGFSYIDSVPLYRTAHDALERLAAELNEVCTFSILDGVEVVYLIRVQGKDVLSRGVGVGSRLPAWATSMGRVLMGGLSTTEQRCLLEKSTLTAYTRHTIIEPEKLLEQVAQAEFNQYCLVQEEYELGVNAISVPIHDRSGKTVAAAGISFNPARFSTDAAVEHFLPKLTQTADFISQHVL